MINFLYVIIILFFIPYNSFLKIKIAPTSVSAINSNKQIIINFIFYFLDQFNYLHSYLHMQPISIIKNPTTLLKYFLFVLSDFSCCYTFLVYSDNHILKIICISSICFYCFLLKLTRSIPWYLKFDLSICSF